MNKKISTAFLTLAALLAPAATTFAAETEGGGGNIFAGDLGNMVWTLVIFVAVLVVLGKYAWGPILERLQAREDFITDSLETAKAEREAAEKTLAEYEQRLAEARAEATAIVEEGRRDSEVLGAKIKEGANAEADKLIARAQREISIAKETAIKDLYAVATQLATAGAARIIKKELDPAEHERLIAEAIDQLESVDN